MLHLLRLGFVTLLCWSMAAYLLRQVVEGVRSGVMRGRGKPTRRRQAPWAFWFHVVFLLLWTAMVLAVWWRAVAPTGAP